MRSRCSLLALPAAILVIAAGAPVRAGEPPGEALALIQAMCLNQQARNAIDSDRVLCSLDLEVKVQNGVAEVSGLVPSKEVGQRAVSRVAAVRGIQEVRPNLFLKETRCQADIPTCVKAAKADSNIDTFVRTRPVEQGLVKNAEGRKVVADLPTARSGTDRAPGLKLLAPRQTNNKESLESKIAKVRESKAAYRDIPVTVKGNDVIVHRSDGKAEAVNAFYRALEGIPGVGDVLLASD